jgi:hypothetical protein
MLDTIIELIARVDVVLYFLSGLGFLLGLRGLSVARRLRREAVFGLEKEAARNARRRGLSTLFSMLLLAGAIFLLTNVVQPTMENMPVAGSDVTGTPELAATPDPATTSRPLLFPTVTPTFGIVAPGEEVAPAPAEEGAPGVCELIGVIISSPIAGEVVAGQVQVSGQANILNFAAYKFEINGPSTDGAWATMGTFTTPVADGPLGTWDATSLMPGAYRLRLVVVDTEGNFPEPCVVPVTIAEPGAQPTPAETPASP